MKGSNGNTEAVLLRAIPVCRLQVCWAYDDGMNDFLKEFYVPGTTGGHVDGKGELPTVSHFR
jgi:hypothetical protein